MLSANWYLREFTQKLKHTNNAWKLIEEIYKYLICELQSPLSGNAVSIQFNIQI